MPQKKLYPNEKTEALVVRMPAELKKRLQNRAVLNRRSMSQEAVLLIKFALDHLDEEQAPLNRQPNH